MPDQGVNSRPQRVSNEYGNPREESHLACVVRLDRHADLLCIADRFRQLRSRRHGCRDILERTGSGDLKPAQGLGICCVRDAAGLVGLAPVPIESGVPGGSAACCVV